MPFSEKQHENSIIFGYDLGIASIGWTVRKDDKILEAGTRIFKSNLDKKGAHKNKKRRESRQRRRGYARKGRRKEKTLNLLQEKDLLEKFDTNNPEEVNIALTRLDALLHRRHGLSSHGDHQKLPYLLRKNALNQKLEADELGRVIYNLNQRRGFLSNRRIALSKEEEKKNSKVKKSIKSIEDLGINIEETDSTLGAYLSGCDPDEERIRGRYTGRNMLEKEFDKIVAEQCKYHEPLRDKEYVKKLKKSIFHQRPLKSQKGRIGFCELEKTERRCPKANPIFQNFRIWCDLANLKWIPKKGSERELSIDEKEKLFRKLQEGDLKWEEAKETLGFATREGKFNLQENKKTFKGNETYIKLRSIFEEKWDGFSGEDREKIADVLIYHSDISILQKIGKKRGLSKESSKIFSELLLEEGYGSLSLKAMNKILPLLKKGYPYEKARREVYPDHFIPNEPLSSLPSLSEAARINPKFNVTNPIVNKTLSELKKIDNELSKKYGKPDKTVIELARDLKKSEKARKETQDNNKKREAERAKAAKALIDNFGIRQPSSRDIEKYLLWEEANKECPYCGTLINAENFHKSQIEHIIPKGKCADNSFQNKTISCWECNQFKANRIPYDAFSEDNIKKIIDRVKNFKGSSWAKEEKLKRFKLQNFEVEEFSNRALSDTSYSTSLAMDYVGLLYGGVVDKDGKQRVFSVTGKEVADFRKAWGMNSILNNGDNSKKSRDDHRHHAVDACVLVCIDNKSRKYLREACARAENINSNRFTEDMPLPWKNFRLDVKEALENSVVSHRPERRLRGEIHKATAYSIVDKDGEKKAATRKGIANLSNGDVKKITDPFIREIVSAKIKEIRTEKGKSLPIENIFKVSANTPYFFTKKGKKTFIRKVKITTSDKPIIFGEGMNKKYFELGNNHHMAIVALLDEEGNEKNGEGHIVSLKEAYDRKRQGKDLIQRDYGEGRLFKFSVATGDSLWNPDTGELFVIKSFDKNSKRIHYVEANNTTTSKLKKDGYFTISLNNLIKKGLRRVRVSPIGEITVCNE